MERGWLMNSNSLETAALNAEMVAAFPKRVEDRAFERLNALELDIRAMVTLALTKEKARKKPR